jgi:quinolinate synthase
MTGRKMAIWDGACHVHSRFSVEALIALKREHPDAPVLAHPECKQTILTLSDVIGSTQALLNYVKSHPDTRKFIIATETGVLHEMQKACPEALFLPVPPEVTEGESLAPDQHIGCMCNECEYMRMVTLEKLYNCLLNESPEVNVEPAVAKQAIIPIQRMLDLS